MKKKDIINMYRKLMEVGKTTPDRATPCIIMLDGILVPSLNFEMPDSQEMVKRPLYKNVHIIPENGNKFTYNKLLKIMQVWQEEIEKWKKPKDTH